MKDKELLFGIFSRNKEKCLDLFGKQIKMGKLEDASEKGSRVYINYFAFAQEILKAYRPEAGTQEKNRLYCSLQSFRPYTRRTS